MTFREKIIEAIKTNRPKLGDSSVKTYVSILSNLHKNLQSSDENISWFNDEEHDIMNYLKENRVRPVNPSYPPFLSSLVMTLIVN